MRTVTFAKVAFFRVFRVCFVKYLKNMNGNSLIKRWRRSRDLISAARTADNIILERRARRSGRFIIRSVVDPFALPEAEFIKTFRLNKSSVRRLSNELAPLIPKERRSDGISVMTKILITLTTFGTGSYQTIIGHSNLHNVSQTTVSKAVKQVTKALNDPRIFKKYVKWPQNHQERKDIKTKFYIKYNIPSVLGCIDGTHVAIIRPIIHEERFYNRKGYHSLNVMLICDSELNILCVDPSAPGSAHDSSVWQSHPLNHHLNQLSNMGEQLFLLGDSGYPLRKTMITPILDAAEGTAERNFYNHHVTARNTVERCIGVLKARFRCLLVARALHYDPVTAGNIVNACCVLHNIANAAKVPVQELTPEEVEVESRRQNQMQEDVTLCVNALMQNQDPRTQRVNPDLLEGRALRQALAQRLWSDEQN